VERLFGQETEYATIGIDAGGKPADQEMLVRCLMDLAAKHLPHLQGGGGLDIYLQNGARLYVDCGLHVEMATPECANPWDVVRYVWAGEEILIDLAGRLTGRNGIAEVILLKSNVDYSGTGSTWGCHESYGHRGAPDAVRDQILPHLVSRIIYTGSGGFNSLSWGLEFTLSPRVPHLSKVLSSDSTHDRGILHTKHEPLSNDHWCRLHLLCGESLCSETAIWLKFGTTALVVAMAEAGLRPARNVTLAQPVKALWAIASDPTCTAQVVLSGGTRATAIEVQRQLLALTEAHVGDAFMPAWADRVCHIWRAILDRLERGPDAVAATLDWAIRHTLYTERLRQNGLSWETVGHWNRVLEALHGSLQASPLRDKMVTVECLLGPSSPVAAEVERTTPFLRQHGLSWDGLRPFVNLRKELLEIDQRFARLGDASVFAALDREPDALAHHVPGVDNIRHAMTNPPAIGRARLRGKAVQRLSGNGNRYVCDWQGIWDRKAGRRLDLSDPLASKQRWQKVPHHEMDPDGFPLGLHEMIERMRARRSVFRDDGGGFRAGDQVILGRHQPVCGSDNWNPDMEPYVGRTATIVDICGHDLSGCMTVHVDIDHGRRVWRTRNLTRPAPQQAPGEASRA
jgi:hypothetical protein